MQFGIKNGGLLIKTFEGEEKTKETFEAVMVYLHDNKDIVKNSIETLKSGLKQVDQASRHLEYKL